MLLYSIEGEFVPLPGDLVRYRLCPIPPKLEKFQAVHVEIVNLTPQVHLRWDSPEINWNDIILISLLISYECVSILIIF